MPLKQEPWGQKGAKGFDRLRVGKAERVSKVLTSEQKLTGQSKTKAFIKFGQIGTVKTQTTVARIIQADCCLFIVQ
jgi:hypothetical protein